MNNNIPTFSIYQTSIENFQRVQGDLSKLQTQVSTGNKAQNFADLGSNISQALSLSTLVTSNNNFSQNNTLVVNQLNTYDSVLQQIQTINSQLQSAITTERSADVATNPLAQTATQMLSTVKNLLNTSFNGQYIFAGAKTDTPPVGDLTTSNLINNQPTDNYYQGDNTTLTTQAGTDINTSYGIKANNPAFTNLIGALNMAINAGNSASPNTDPDLSTALDLTNTVTSGLSNLQAQNGDTMSQLQQININYTNDATYIQNAQGFENTDLAGASVQVTEDQTTLQAAYEVFAKISSLNLASFLSSGG